MTNIPNTEYLTINADGIFIGEKPTMTYRGQKIGLAHCAISDFKSFQEMYPYVVELHCLSSETTGKYAEAGNPSGAHGANGWCRVRFNDDKTSAWVFCDNCYADAAFCAETIAHSSAQHMRYGSFDLRSTVLAQDLKDNDVSDIPNTEYITINADGFFIGEKPTTTYRDQEIELVDYAIHDFKSFQEKYPKVAELHCLSSETLGKENTAGNPSSRQGVTQWCRVKFNDGKTSAWVFLRESHPTTPVYCAHACVHECAYSVRWGCVDTLVALGIIDKPKKIKENKKMKIREVQNIDTSDLDSALRILLARDDLVVKGPGFYTRTEKGSPNEGHIDTDFIPYDIYEQGVFKLRVQREDSTFYKGPFSSYGSTSMLYYAIINDHKYRIKKDIYKLAENYESNKREQTKLIAAANTLAADIAFISR